MQVGSPPASKVCLAHKNCHSSSHRTVATDRWEGRGRGRETKHKNCHSSVRFLSCRLSQWVCFHSIGQPVHPWCLPGASSVAPWCLPGASSTCLCGNREANSICFTCLFFVGERKSRGLCISYRPRVQPRGISQCTQNE